MLKVLKCLGVSIIHCAVLACASLKQIKGGIVLDDDYYYNDEQELKCIEGFGGGWGLQAALRLLA